MSEKTCIIIGASHAGVSLALQLRKEGWTGPITLVGAEREIPYHRPPLSKEHLAGSKELDAMRLRPAQVFEDQNIELLLGTTVIEIDREARAIKLDNGEVLSYDKLALCTGALVRTLPVGGSLSHIFYVRTAADVGLLRAQVSEGKSAVIIGAGYIGLEAASVLRQAGLKVTVVEMSERVLERVTSPPMSEFVQRLHEDHGVIVKTATQVTAIRGEAQVEQVVCSDGTRLQADFVIVGIGVVPNTALARAADLAIDEGILVDEFCCTSDPDIYAAGDCTRHPSALYGRLLRLESVQNANDQARAAAANICGKQQAYDAVPWFWSDQFHIKLQMVGVSQGYEQLVMRGSPDSASTDGFALFYLKDSRLIAADCVNRPQEFMACKKLVQAQVEIDSQRLADQAIGPASWLD